MSPQSTVKVSQKPPKTLSEKTGGGILVITEGVFGMSGDLGDLKGISELKKKFNFRIFVDDAHGIGTMGAEGRGAGEELGCQDEIDVYFGTFAKSFASVGAFISSTEDIVEYLRYNMRSQVYAKSLPMPLVIGNLKRLDMLKNSPEIKPSSCLSTNLYNSIWFDLFFGRYKFLLDAEFAQEVIASM
ncbi:MAG TPA: aminotransferase class I/II-fold pyridoxal phosphate-dependent enzyme [Nitrospinaceae bacterium]|nr:aminotransferase class I/II-fold pyridoxal phosphate-dependent enzyme [Nitrospinaceae bacterium]